MMTEIARYEFRLQTREFLTWVYVAVFFFLTFGYATSGAVELVSSRGDVPKVAPWAMAHAMAGVTAFGQVITTMIAATAVMRDVATRQQELLFTTALTRHDYLLGRWMGAVGVMLLVYLAIPAGLLVGFAMNGQLTQALKALWWPCAWLVLPNLLVVSVLFFSAGALRRGFMSILLLGVGLVALWGTGVSLARDGQLLGAWLDPFGNAALEWVSRGLSGEERARFEPSAAGVVWQNRVLWLGVAAAAAMVVWHRFRLELFVDHATPAVEGVPAPAVHHSSAVIVKPPAAMDSIWLLARWSCRWTLREKGFTTLAALGALNALVNAWIAGGAQPTMRDIMSAVHEHARVFLILVATIYAGELVWRDRDVRSHELRDTLPVSNGALMWGQLLGVLTAQLVVVLPLLLVGVSVAFMRDASGFSLLGAFGWSYGVTFTFLAQITLLSLLVHAAVQHKVAGHVLLIAGWVLAVAIDRGTSVPAALRYAALPDEWTPRQAVQLELLWSVAALCCAAMASRLWTRGTGSGSRLSNALRGRA